MSTVAIKSLERLQHLVVTGDHALVADEPPPQGDAAGPTSMSSWWRPWAPERR